MGSFGYCNVAKRCLMAIAMTYMTFGCSNDDKASVRKDRGKVEFDVAADGLSLRNGVADATQDKSVFKINTKDSEGKSAFGTAFNVFGPRCLLTSGHALRGASELKIQVGITPGNGAPSQEAEKWEALDPNDRYRDLGLVWMKNLKTEGATIRVDENLGDYKKLDLVSDIGLKHVEFEVPPSTSKISESAPKKGITYGYGHNDHENGADTGAGTRRGGGLTLLWYSIGKSETAPKAGSVYTSTRVLASDVEGCASDSGSPGIVDGKVFGVLQGGAGPLPITCKNSTRTFFTGLEDVAPEGTQTNWSWVHKTADKICAKKIEGKVNGGGKIDSTIDRPRKEPSDPELNGEISCGGLGGTDCIENMAVDMTANLFATADEGYTFTGWESGETECPCAGSHSPICTASYDSIGKYTATTSVDISQCVAVFTQESPEPTITPDPTDSPEPTYPPEPTDSPEPTIAPDPTATAEPTITPEPTESPEPTVEPDPTEEPEPTSTPDPSESPEPTPTPDPVPSDSPDHSATPVPSEEPIPSQPPVEACWGDQAACCEANVTEGFLSTADGKICCLGGCIAARIGSPNSRNPLDGLTGDGVKGYLDALLECKLKAEAPDGACAAE